MSRRPSPIVGIFITVLLDLLSFGMFLPDLQIRLQSLAGKMLRVPPERIESDASVGLAIGLVIAGFSFAQLLAAPVLGGLSDRFGRRPILLITCALAVASNLLYAFSDLYPLVFVARVLSGLAAANLGVAFAYIADVTEPEARAASLGKLGAAFGLGFVFGPPLGGLLLYWGGRDQILLGLVASGLAALNLFWVWRFLPESLARTDGTAARREPFLVQLRIALSTRGLALLLGIFFLVNLGMASLQTTFILLLANSRSIFRLGKEDAETTGAIILGLVGLFTALMQLLVVPRAVKALGERRMMQTGVFVLIFGLGLVPYAPLWAPLVAVVALQAIANGLAQPALSSLISRAAPPRIQGGIFGINQALGAAARGLSPFVAIPLLTRDPHLPYLFAASVAILASTLTLRRTAGGG